MSGRVTGPGDRKSRLRRVARGRFPSAGSPLWVMDVLWGHATELFSLKRCVLCHGNFISI